MPIVDEAEAAAHQTGDAAAAALIVDSTANTNAADVTNAKHNNNNTPSNPDNADGLSPYFATLLGRNNSQHLHSSTSRLAMVLLLWNGVEAILAAGAVSGIVGGWDGMAGIGGVVGGDDGRDDLIRSIMGNEVDGNDDAAQMVTMTLKSKDAASYLYAVASNVIALEEAVLRSGYNWRMSGGGSGGGSGEYGSEDVTVRQVVDISLVSVTFGFCILNNAGYID